MSLATSLFTMHRHTYLHQRAIFGASNLFVCLMKARLVSVFIFYLLPLCLSVSLAVRFIIFATCQFVTYLSDSRPLIQHPPASIMHGQEWHSDSRFAYSYLSILWWAGRVAINHWLCTRICPFPLIDEDESMSIIRTAEE